MTRFLAAAMGAISLLAGAPSAPRLGLAEAIRAAVQKVKAEDARREVASQQLRLLEAANKWKIELRPSLGLLSFSHPAILAASLGSGLFFGKRNAPSPVAMAGARFDVLEAEIASERQRARTEIETARAYFDLLEKQQIARQVESALGTKQQQEKQMERLLQAARVTAVDRISLQEEVLALELQRVEIQMQRRLASGQLADLMGLRTDVENLTVEETTVDDPGYKDGLPEVETLLSSALVYRKESQLLRDKIHDLRSKAGLPGGAPLESISAGYSYLANGERESANPVRPNLIGGHVGQLGIGLSIPLRQTGERSAERNLLMARIQALELQAREMEDELRSELLAMRSVVQASTEREKLAARRVQLSRQKKNMIKVRADNGLTGYTSEASAEEADLHAEAALVRAACSRRNSLFTLMVLCGKREDRPDALQQVAGN